MNYLLLDTSYIIFYRYYALIQWWKLANKDVELSENPFENNERLNGEKTVTYELIKESTKHFLG
jgi:hypothetical protein